MRWLCVTSLLLLIGAAGGTCRAEDRLGLGVKAGTLGVGVDLTGRFNDWFGLRASVNQYNYSHGFDKEAIHYDGPGRIGFVFDLGVMPQGRPQVSLASSTGLVSSADLQMEQSKVSDDTKNFKLWPVIAVGPSFRL